MGKRILIAAPVNEQEKIFKEYLFSLNSLKIPKEYTVNKFFILSKNSSLSSLLQKNEYIYENNNFSIDKEKGYHNWTIEKFLNIAYLRSCLLEKAREENYDYLFTVDSDILIHPKTLEHLLKLNLPVVTEGVWTKNPQNISLMDGQFENWQHFKNKNYNTSNIYEINWGGMITLIHSSIFNIKTINYMPLKEVAGEFSEDWSFFCKIYCHFPDFKLYMDTTYLGRHLYNESCYNRWIKEKEKYE